MIVGGVGWFRLMVTKRRAMTRIIVVGLRNTRHIPKNMLRNMGRGYNDSRELSQATARQGDKRADWIILGKIKGEKKECSRKSSTKQKGEK